MVSKSDDPGPSVKLVIHMPADLKQRLQEAMAERGFGERGLSQDIRQRLEASLQADKLDVPGRYLGALVTNLAESVNHYFGHWSQNAFAHDVLRLCVERLLQTMAPAGAPVAAFNPDSLADVLFDPEDREGIARSLVVGALQSTPNVIRKAGGTSNG